VPPLHLVLPKAIMLNMLHIKKILTEADWLAISEQREQKGLTNS
jgi:hypothetical protein